MPVLDLVPPSLFLAVLCGLVGYHLFRYEGSREAAIAAASVAVGAVAGVWGCLFLVLRISASAGHAGPHPGVVLGFTVLGVVLGGAIGLVLPVWRALRHERIPWVGPRLTRVRRF
jgi:hypothetical protein